MILTRRPQISQNLGRMFSSKRFASLEVNNQTALDKQVGIVISQNCSVFIQNLERMLLLNLQSGLSQPVSQSILIYFFQVTMTKIDMQVKSNLPDLITLSKISFSFINYAPSVPYVAILP